jgi:predicted transcriptional regulator of viral defense system
MRIVALPCDTVILFRSFWGNIMSMEYKAENPGPRLDSLGARFKTLGPRSSDLWVQLHERGETIFTLREAEEITGLHGSSTRTLVHKAERRGLVTRLRSGLYTLVPFEMGRATEYVGDPYVIAREMCEGRDYFISHASAMELHRMVTQPQLTIFVSSTLRTPARSIHGHEYRFVTVKPSDFFGLTQLWVTKQQSVMVSDKERTLIDALRQPQYAGSIPEVAKALWMSRSEIKVPKLMEYLEHFSSGALKRRLGFLLELYAMASPDQLESLRSKLTSTYDRLDPTLPKSGSFQARWRLQLNIGVDELEAIPHT